MLGELITVKAVAGLAKRGVKWIATNWLPLLLIIATLGSAAYVWWLIEDRHDLLEAIELRDRAMQTMAADLEEAVAVGSLWVTVAERQNQAIELYLQMDREFDEAIRALLPPPVADADMEERRERVRQTVEDADDPASAIADLGVLLVGGLEEVHRAH